MQEKDNDFTIVTMISHDTVQSEVEISEVRNLIENYLQLMPMWPALLALLKEKNIVEQSNDGTWGALNGSLILSILNSPIYLSMCPKVRIAET
jgi:hypothetical protein